ncbi:MAG: MFS transporter [Chloroflexi bacterium]|nr:MAG: MFS transporter [Chloroflexota bacterium]TMG43698.1 MAG: MFS transporter [Chloroflexota bacterium]
MAAGQANLIIPPVARGYARYVLALMVGINLLNYMDRWVAASAGPLIEKELGISDSLFGLLGTAFLLVYAIAAVPFGYWGDRGVRKTVIGVGVTIWSIATLFTGFARSYFQLFLSRAIVGIGEASYYPAGTSLLSDYFPKEQRSRVAAVWGAGSTVGIALGFAGGGFIAEKLGWRAAFFFAAVPGLLFAILAFQMREPLRGAAEARGAAVARTADASFRKFIDLMRIPTLRATIIAQTLLFFVLASNAFWLPTVLQRRFEMTAGRAGLLAGVVIVVGGLIGTLAGGWLADRRALATPKAHLEVGIIGFLAGAVLITVAILSPLNIGPIPVFIPVFLLTVICLYLYAGPFTAVSQNVVSPGLRASAVTLLLFVAHVFGDSHSTFDIGLLSDRLGGNLQLALLITSPTLLILAAIAAATGLRTIKRDTEAMEEDWAARTGDPALTRA